MRNQIKNKRNNPANLNDSELDIEMDSSDPESVPLARTSMAYASASPTSSLMSKLNYHLRVNYKAVLASVSFALIVLSLSSDTVHHGSSSVPALSTGGWGLRGAGLALFGGASYPGYFKAQDAIVDANTFKFAAVTDLDQLSRKPDSSKLMFQSMLMPGVLKHDPSTNLYEIKFDNPRMLYSGHNEAGRGMELSELTLYNDRLLAFDDRTGTVFELINKEGGKETIVVPRLVITEGDGDTDKGMKWEWATVKGGELYMGSMGKEYTNPDGSIANTNNLWIAIIDSEGRVRRKDWSDEYNVVRAALGASPPGYVMHEAILWSQHLKKWVFVPRRVSSEDYDEEKDERKGSNKIVLVDDKFRKAEVIDIKFKEIDPLHGFSSIAFIPGSHDRHALSIRSVEEDCVGGDESVCKQRSYFSVFDVTTGNVLMDEIELKLDTKMKFEGVEFVDIFTPEPMH